MVSPIINNTAIIEYKAEDKHISEIDMRISNIVKGIQSLTILLNTLTVKIQAFGMLITENIQKFALAISMKIQLFVQFSSAEMQIA